MNARSIAFTTFAGIAIACLVIQVRSEDRSHASWGYVGENGPERWGELSPDYVLAKIGRNQSPIDIAGPAVIDADLPEIEFDYHEVPLEIINNGHTIQVNYPVGSSITVDETEFALLQFHFHSPSENTIDGKSYPLEVHLVHADADGNLAVVGVMFKPGESHPLIGRLWDRAPKDKGEPIRVEGDKVNAADLLPDDRDYYRFTGSLTTPPCSEGVRWLVMKEALEVSTPEARVLQGLMGFPNNRPVQPKNARAILE